MEPLKLAGLVVLALGIIEAFVWRILAPQNPNLARLQPILMISAASMVVIGIVLLLV